MAGDPYWDSVVSLLHFTGADGSSAIKDEKGKVWTAAGNARISTAQSVFGGSSLYSDASSGSHLSEPNAIGDAIGAGDFTIEGFIRSATVSGSSDVGICVSDADGSGIFREGNKLFWWEADYRAMATKSLVANVWVHFEATRASGVLRIFTGGTNSPTTYNSAVNWSGYATYLLADNAGGERFNGNLAEVRVTAGVARYVANFTPPTPPFSNGKFVYRAAGTVQVDSTPTARRVRVYSLPAGLVEVPKFLGQDKSDASSGAYAIDFVLDAPNPVIGDADDDYGGPWLASTACALDVLSYPTTPNGHYYKCTTAGTSGATEPSWSGTTITDGSVTWTDQGTMRSRRHRGRTCRRW